MVAFELRVRGFEQIDAEDVGQAHEVDRHVGAPVTYIEQVADAILNHDTDLLVTLGTTRGHLTVVDVIRRDDGRLVPVDVEEQRYTTRGLLLTEQRAINRAIARRDANLAIAPDEAVVAAVGRRTLTGEQESIVRRLTSSGAGVEVVVGKAGVGKTYALDAAREAWETCGVRVRGVALAARAALELQESSGISSTTLARLTGQLDDHRAGSPLAPGSVLVVGGPEPTAGQQHGCTPRMRFACRRASVVGRRLVLAGII